MKLLSHALSELKELCLRKDIANPLMTSRAIIGHICKIHPSELFFHQDLTLDESQWRLCKEMMVRKSFGEPLEYIFGEVLFDQCLISLNSHALIPRPETELLLYKIYLAVEKKGAHVETVWDLCCGSGCLGINMKRRFPHLKVALSDISEKCCSLSKENATKNSVEVEIYQGDFLEPFKGKKADLVICNPPYVSEEAYTGLDPSVRAFEPKEALIAGKTGYEFYRRLANEISAYLNPNAKVFLEIGAGQGPKIREIFDQKHWKSVAYDKDWAGHDRFFFLEYHSFL